MNDFFDITWQSLNLFSFIIGMITGLCFYSWANRFGWLSVIAYFMLVAFYFAIQAGILKNIDLADIVKFIEA